MKEKIYFFSVLLTFIRFQFDNRTHFSTIAHAILFNFSECFRIKSQTALHPLTKWQTQFLLFDEKKKFSVHLHTHSIGGALQFESEIKVYLFAQNLCQFSIHNFILIIYISAQLSHCTRIQLYAIDIFSGLEMMSIIRWSIFRWETTTAAVERKKKHVKMFDMSKTVCARIKVYTRLLPHAPLTEYLSWINCRGTFDQTISYIRRWVWVPATFFSMYIKKSFVYVFSSIDVWRQLSTSGWERSNQSYENHTVFQYWGLHLFFYSITMNNREN